MSFSLLKHKPILAAAIIFCSGSVSAKPLGLGIILFGPTGISGNYFFARDRSVDGAMSWSLNDDKQKLYLHSTYLFHRRNLFAIDNVRINGYFGGGARLISWDDPPGKGRDSETRLGARGVGGLSYTFNKPTIEVFTELSVTMDLIPETDADLMLGFGARYYF